MSGFGLNRGNVNKTKLINKYNVVNAVNFFNVSVAMEMKLFSVCWMKVDLVSPTVYSIKTAAVLKRLSIK